MERTSGKSVLVGCGNECRAGSIIWLLVLLEPSWLLAKKEEALKNEYMDRRMLWRKSEKMTMQQMLSDMTLMDKGDSVLVCWLTGLSLPVYRDFIHGITQPTRNAWAETRYWYMSSLAKGREWMEERAKRGFTRA